MSVNVYQMVTDRIIAELEKGVVSWNKPWFGSPDGAYNMVSNKPYSLLNQMLLGKAGPWLSFKQVNDLGGKIRRGEKSSFVVFWKMQETTTINADGEEVKRVIPLLRYYNVWHASQCDNLKIKERPAVEHRPIEEAETVLNDYWIRERITVEHILSDEAYYSPSRDLIHLPLLGQFKDVNEYYSVAYHESIHSTLKASRCNKEADRNGRNVSFGSAEYSLEELVAEIGSAMMLNHLGIETSKTFKQSAGYIASWISVLRNDNKFIVSASSKAEKAVQYILGTPTEQA